MMRMMGVLTIDAVGARLDDWVDVAFDFYYRRMTLASDLSKTSPVQKGVLRARRPDPPLGTSISGRS
jgi:hypothetical protein